MPTYRVTDPNTGKTLRLTGDSPPTEQELNEVFSQFSAEAPQAKQSGKSLSGFGSNVLSSGINLATGIGQAVAHPISTARTVASLPLGLVQKAGRNLGQVASGRQNLPAMPSEQTLNSVIEMYRQRYGGLKNTGETFYSDPVGAVADLATVLSAGAGALGKAGQVSKISQLSSAGAKVGQAANFIDPLQFAIRQASKAKEVVGAGTGAVFSGAGGITTGTGLNAVREAFTNPSKDFVKALRGQVSQRDILKTAQDALQNVKDTRQAEYLAKMTPAKGSGVIVSLEPTRKIIPEVLGKFGVKLREAMDGPSPLEKLSQKMQDSKFVLDELTNAIEQNPVRELTKYANKNRELPEALGKGGKFGKTGDSLAQEFGFSSSEQAREAYGEYTRMLDHQKELQGVLKDSTEQLKTAKRTLVPDKEIDFDRSVISDSSEQKIISRAVNDINSWDDFSVEGIDRLKQRIGNLYSPTLSDKAKKIISELKGSIKKPLEEVPGYKEATSGYAKASDLLSEIERGLNLKEGGNPQTAITKLFTTLRANKELQQALISELDKQGKGNITGMIAGSQLNPATPQGLAKYVTGALTSGTAGAGLLNPALLPLLGGALLSSPRLIGEAALKVGQASREATKVTKSLGQALKTGTSSAGVNRLLELIGSRKNQ